MTGPELLRILEELGMSQRRLSLLLGVHYNTVRNWTHRKDDIPRSRAHMIRLVVDTLRRQS